MFDDSKIYLTTDPALAVIAAPSTMAHWRSEGRGPAYIKLGLRVGYLGRALNEWIASRTVRPTERSRSHGAGMQAG